MSIASNAVVTRNPLEPSRPLAGPALHCMPRHLPRDSYNPLTWCYMQHRKDCAGAISDFILRRISLCVEYSPWVQCVLMQLVCHAALTAITPSKPQILTDFFASHAVNGTLSCDEFFANETPQVRMPLAHALSATFP